MRVCVFGSSSKSTNERYVEAAYEFGKFLGERKSLCVNGGGRFGVMGGLNRGCLEVGGDVKGVIHEKFCVDFGENKEIANMIIAAGDDLYERKHLLFNNGDCIISLPGGPGTFDEFWEAVLHKSLGMKGLTNKPICLVNIDGFYDGFLLQMKRAQQDGILYGDIESYYHVANDCISAYEWCEQQLKTMPENKIIASKFPNRKLQRRSSYLKRWWLQMGVFSSGLILGILLVKVRTY